MINTLLLIGALALTPKYADDVETPSGETPIVENEGEEEKKQVGITYDLTYVTLSDPVDKLYCDSINTIEFVADDGYKVPEEIEVTGCENYLWDSTTSVLAISYPTEDVSVKIVGIEAETEEETYTKSELQEEIDKVISEIEAQYEKIKNTELIGGLTIGSIVSACISFLGVYLSSHKSSSKVKTVATKVEELDELVDKVMKNYDDSKLVSNSLVNDMKSQLDQLKEIINNEDKYKEALEDTEKKIDVLLDSLKTMACNSNDLVKSGVAKEIEEKIKDIEG